MGAEPPIDDARRISLLILAHAEELRPRAACARGNCPCIDARSTRTNRHMLQTYHRWENEQLPFRFNPFRSEELRPRAACARGNCPCIDARSTRTNRHMLQTYHRWENEQLPFRFNPD